jgi:hypothetical protein
MHYILEAFFVGLYSLILCVITSFFIDNFYVLLFVTGIVKHFLGYLLNIHTFYCNNGYACLKIHKYSNKKNDKKNDKKNTDNNFVLLIECIVEGILFLVLGYFLKLFIKYKPTIFFLIGFLLHLIFEWLNIHQLFCKYRCNNL